MASLEISPGNNLHYEYDAPGQKGQTFVFVNALTGNTGMWQVEEIGPALRAAGYGTLCYNFRGQAESAFVPGIDLGPLTIVEDLKRVVDEVAPPNPILVGLSIGGLFAAQAYLKGAAAEGLVLINTLRKPNLRLEWINAAMVRMAATGGSQLIMEANLPMLVNPEQLAKMRPNLLKGPYQPMKEGEGLYELMKGSVSTDWDFPYEKLDVPVLLMTGTHDRVFRIEEDIAELEARIPSSSHIVFTDAGHLIPAERPARFAKELMAFAATL
ncbi:alpha/beta hydrolase [Nisaea acidiphila]|uniref:Alpha/beta hydrolase n=1 Tax=Nisaea acidiphila TaxID=1862145 RepID=A0A9J7AWK7_9PROT|nr:alpha/beta hydrolase [Nisaea acidiphila]UUX49821.1 alpha/beta hydrolase [Nisaea acidiphila]